MNLGFNLQKASPSPNIKHVLYLKCDHKAIDMHADPECTSVSSHAVLLNKSEALPSRTKFVFRGLEQCEFTGNADLAWNNCALCGQLVTLWNGVAQGMGRKRAMLDIFRRLY